MTRIVTFADSFVSATEPSLEGINQEDYVIQNNVIDQALFTINQSVYKSAFFDYEIIRSDDSGTYSEVGRFQFLYDNGSWQYAKGIAAGEEVISSEIVEPYNVVFSFSTLAGVGTFKYSSGNMGLNYSGTLKISISRIVA